MVDWLKKAPTAVVVTLIIVMGLLAAAVIGAFVVLQINGQDTAPLRQWITAIGTPLISLLLGVNTVASVQSARSASNAEDQTNGQLTSRDARIAQLEGVVRSAGLVVPASTVVERKAGN